MTAIPMSSVPAAPRADSQPARSGHVADLTRVRWAVRATLLLGVAASVAANILHAQPHPVSQVIAAWPPVALLLTVELIARVPVHRLILAAARLVATTVIAGIAAWVSYWHMAAVAAHAGEVGASAYLLPVSVDGLIIVASVSLVELSGRLRAAQAQPSPPEGTHPSGRSHRSAPAPEHATPLPSAPSTIPPTGQEPVGDTPSRTAPDDAPLQPQQEPDRRVPSVDRIPQHGERPHPGDAGPQDSVTQRPRRGATEKAVIETYLKNPALHPTAIAELVGTSERSVRRYLERLKTAAAPDSANGANSTGHGHNGGNPTGSHP